MPYGAIKHFWHHDVSCKTYIEALQKFGAKIENAVTYEYDAASKFLQSKDSDKFCETSDLEFFRNIGGEYDFSYQELYDSIGQELVTYTIFLI